MFCRNTFRNITVLAAALLLLFLAACRSNHSYEQDEKPPAKPIPNSGFSEFTDTPPGLEGCSCFFSKDSVSMEGRKYIIATDFDSSAYLKVNGAFVQLKLSDSRKMTDGAAYMKFASEEYEAVFQIRTSIPMGEGASMKKGTLLFGKKGFPPRIRNIFGTCGC